MKKRWILFLGVVVLCATVYFLSAGSQQSADLLNKAAGRAEMTQNKSHEGVVRAESFPQKSSRSKSGLGGIEALRQCESSKARLDTLTKILNNGFTENWVKIIDFIKSDFPEEERSLALGIIATYAPGYSPSMYFSLLEDVSPGRQYVSLLRAGIDGLTSTEDKIKLLELTIKRREPDELSGLLNIVENSRSGLSWLNLDSAQLGKVLSITNDPRYQAAIAKNVGSNSVRLKSSVESLNEFTQKMPKDFRDHFWESYFKSMSYSSPELVPDFISQSSQPQESKIESAQALAGVLVSKADYKTAFDLSNKFKDDVRYGYLAAVATNWYQQDSNSASSFTKKMPSGRDKDCFIQELVEFTMQHDDADSARAWLSQVSDPQLKDSLGRKIEDGVKK
ncbi:MAG: hypothetical protein CFE26_18270 [Verrucomicrobiales bacterium VVV1]|nr:MAG: hypothetical protein CFE26_18270 [Verrucomicrobiales bacterium VVV1]